MVHSGNRKKLVLYHVSPLPAGQTVRVSYLICEYRIQRTALGHRNLLPERGDTLTYHPYCCWLLAPSRDVTNNLMISSDFKASPHLLVSTPTFSGGVELERCAVCSSDHRSFGFGPPCAANTHFGSPSHVFVGVLGASFLLALTRSEGMAIYRTLGSV